MAQRITIRELLTRFVFDGDTEKVQKFDRALGIAKTTAVAVAATAVAGGAAFVAFTLKMTAAGDAVAKTADQAQVAVETWDELGAVVEFGGGNIGTMSTALRSLSKNLGDFIRTGKGEAKEAFDALGITREQAKGFKTADVALEAIAEGLKGVADPLLRVDIAASALGRSGTELLPLLKGGAEGIRALREEARQAGTWTEALARQSEELTDNLFRFKLQAKGVFLAMVEELIPVAVDLSEEWLVLVKGAQGFVKLQLAQVARGVAGAFRSMSDVLLPLAFRLSATVQHLRESERVLAAVKTTALFLGAVLLILALQQFPALAAAAVRAGAAFLASGARAALAWVLAAAPVILLASLLTGIVLILDDILGFFQGKKSITGSFVKWLQESGGLLKEVGDYLERLREVTQKAPWEGFGASFGAMLDLLSGKWRSFITNLRYEAGTLPLVGQFFSGRGRPTSSPRASSRGGSSVTVEGGQTVIQISGAGDPLAVAQEVEKRQSEASRDESSRVARQLQSVMVY